MEWLLDDPAALQRRDRYRKRHGVTHLWVQFPQGGSITGLSFTECHHWYDEAIVTADAERVTCRRCLHSVPKTGGRRSRSIPAPPIASETKEETIHAGTGYSGSSGHEHTCMLLPNHKHPEMHRCICGHWWRSGPTCESTSG